MSRAEAGFASLPLLPRHLASPGEQKRGSQARLSIAAALIADVLVVVTFVIAVVYPAVAKIVWEDISIVARGGGGLQARLFFLDVSSLLASKSGVCEPTSFVLGLLWRSVWRARPCHTFAPPFDLV